MNRDDLTAAIRYPNLFGLTNGTVSGNLLDWPLLPVEARAALAEIDRLTAPDPTMTAEPTDLDAQAALTETADER